MSDIWADSAYYSVNMEATLAILGYASHIHERGYRNHPLNEEQKASNKEKSKTRARVEHVFGHWVTSMGESGCATSALSEFERIKDSRR